jgi:hypothetical protein
MKGVGHSRLLSAADRDMKKKTHDRVLCASVHANIVEEDHKWRIYSAGGGDGNRAKGVWGRQGLE